MKSFLNATNLEDFQLTISFHRDNLQIPSKIPSIQATYWKPISIASHCYCIRYTKIAFLIQWVSCSAIKICENFGETTSWYTTPLIWNLSCQSEKLVNQCKLVQHKWSKVATQIITKKGKKEMKSFFTKTIYWRFHEFVYYNN